MLYLAQSPIFKWIQRESSLVDYMNEISNFKLIQNIIKVLAFIKDSGRMPLAGYRFRDAFSQLPDLIETVYP